MLRMTIGGNEYYDERQNRFITTPAKTVMLEHSLRAVAKWESKWNISFFSEKEKTREQSIDYVRCMDINGHAPADLFQHLTKQQMEEINAYISAKMTATTITRRGPQKKNSGKITTAELIYCWMIQLGIPPEYDKWHLNRLLTLIEVCSLENAPKQKMGMKEQMAQQRALNAARKAKLNTRG